MLWIFLVPAEKRSATLPAEVLVMSRVDPVTSTGGASKGPNAKSNKNRVTVLSVTLNTVSQIFSLFCLMTMTKIDSFPCLSYYYIHCCLSFSLVA